MTDIGDNIKQENEARVLFFHHMRKRVSHNDAIKELQEERKKDGNKAKADNIKLTDLDFAIHADQMEDKNIPASTFQMHGKILSWLGILPGFQGDLLKDRMPALERIEAQGERAGLLNKPRESGYQKKSNEDVAWLKGHDAGQKLFKDHLENALADASKSRQNGKGGSKTRSVSKTAPLSGDTPPEKKKAEKPEKPKPGAKRAQKAGDDGKTNDEREGERQGRADFH